MVLASGTKLGPYAISGPLSHGGMGEVYRARDTRLDREVAIKVLPEHLSADTIALKRFERETKAVAALSHPNILTIHDVGSEQGISFAVMELLQGETLREMFAGGAIPLLKVLEVGTEVAAGLTAAHAKGIIHRDLKPENIFVTSDGRVKILDFGLAQYNPQQSQNLTEAVTRSQVTAAGVVMGTLPYMSPEQVLGTPVDARTDIFSLGCVLYEMVTGKRAFAGNTSAEIITGILRDHPAGYSSNVPPKLIQLISHCLEKTPEQRFRSANDLLHELRSLAINGVPAAKASKAPRWIQIVAAIAFALLAMIALIFTLRKGTPNVPTASKIQSLAVLPLQNLSGDPKQEYFSDGMTEQLIATLAHIRSLKVISRTSVMEYKHAQKKIPEIAKELNVDAIVEGSVLQSGNRVRITAQLIQGATDQHLWAQSYDRNLSDVLALQSEVASSIAQEIQIQLTPQEKAQLADTPKVNAEAYQAYILGREHGRASFTLDDLQLSIQLLQRSVELDPNFVDAFVELTRSHSLMYHMGYDRTDLRKAMAKEALDRACVLQPDSANAHIAGGWYYYYVKKDYDRAFTELSRARQQSPNNPDPVLGITAIKRRKGDYQGAIDGFKEVLALSPRDADRWRELGLTYTGLRRFADAEVAFNRGISIAPDNSTIYVEKAHNLILGKGDIPAAREILRSVEGGSVPWERIGVELCAKNYSAAMEQIRISPFNTFVGWPADNAQFTPKSAMAGIIYLLSGQREKSRHSFEEARTVLETELKKQPDDQRVHSCLGVVLAGLGLKQEAVHEGKLALELYPVTKDAYAAPFLVANLAFIYTLTGENEAAIEQLQYLLSRPTHLMSVQLLRIDPRWDSLRNDPQFQKLLQ